MSKLKYYDGTNWKIVNGQVTGDTLPIGAIVEFDGQDIPAGWEEVTGTNKIKKVSQSAGLIANVSNIQSDSTTDTYSCDYANNTFQNKPTILFTGNTTGQVLLSQSAANFTYLEIFYQGADNFNSTKLYNPNGKSAYLITGWMANNTTRNVKLARVSISGTTISKTNYTSLNYDSNYANASEENGISITTVIGYK